MAKQETSTLGKILGFVGLLAGFTIGYNATQNGIAALIAGAIVGSLGVYAGEVITRIIIICISVAIAVAMIPARQAVVQGVVEAASGSASQSAGPKAQPQQLEVRTGKRVLQLCNSSKDLFIDAAVMHWQKGRWVVRGWWTIKQGQCANLELEYEMRTAGVFALSKTSVWEGGLMQCVTYERAFERNATEVSTCPSNFRKEGFRQIDMGKSRTFAWHFGE